MSSPFRLALILLCGALCACSLAPRYVRPGAPVPASWPAGDPYLKNGEGAVPSVDYQQIFTDARLRQLIGVALESNRDLRIAAGNISTAREAYRIQRAERLPQIEAGIAATRGGSDTSASADEGKTRLTANVGATAFELDLFGRVRSLSDSALQQYFATEAAARATRLILIGDVAAAWSTYGADRSLLRIAEETAQTASRSVELTRARLKGGVAPRTDLRQAEQILAQAQSDVAQLRTQLAQDVNAIQLLAGSPVEAALLPASIDEVANGTAEISAGIDSAVLLRRPDVLQAEHLLRSANAEIGSARAALFPRISLTAIAGVASTALNGLFNGEGSSWSTEAAASYPIFDTGASRAGVRQSEARRDVALATYEKTIQSAFRDVADALARRGTLDEQLRADTADVAASTDYFRLADARYRGGIDTFLTSLDAQRSLYSAQRTLVATRLAEVTNRVDLYRALGADEQASR